MFISTERSSEKALRYSGTLEDGRELGARVHRPLAFVEDEDELALAHSAAADSTSRVWMSGSR